MFRNVNSSSQLSASYLVPIPLRNDIPKCFVMIHLRNRIPKCLTWLLFRVQECGQVSAARLYPQIFVPVEFWIRDAVNRMGETILAQVRCLRYDWGYRQ